MKRLGETVVILLGALSALFAVAIMWLEVSIALTAQPTFSSRMAMASNDGGRK